MSDQKVTTAIEMLSELVQDSTIPKNVKLRMNQIVDILKQNTDKSIKVDKVMHMFDELNDDPNIDPYTRTQLWNIISLLESM